MKKFPALIAAGSAVLSGQVCPYCNGSTEYVDSIAVYDKSEGMIYLCRPCQAWVGVHRGTVLAFGSVAKAGLRQLRMLAHRWFDPLAVEGLINDIYPVHITGMGTREKAYYWLAEQMGINREYCHIGMFNEAQCEQVVAICRPVVESLEGTGDIY